MNLQSGVAISEYQKLWGKDRRMYVDYMDAIRQFRVNKRQRVSTWVSILER